MTYTYPDTTVLKDMTVEKALAFLKSPTLFPRLVNELAAQTFLADFLFPRRMDTSGVAVYAVSAGESVFYTNREPEIVAPGAEYPFAMPLEVALATAETAKWGQKTEITDERIKLYKMDEVKRGAGAIVNTIRRKIDTVSLTGAAAAITKTVTAPAAWKTATGNPFLDVELAVASIEDEEEGYSPDTLLVTSENYAYLADRLKVMDNGAGNSVIGTGNVPPIAGLTVVKAPARRMPAGVGAIVIDRQRFGALAYNDLPSPEFTGSSAVGIETSVTRNPDMNDAWLLRGRRVVVPVIQEPSAARKIMGA